MILNITAVYSATSEGLGLTYEDLIFHEITCINPYWQDLIPDEKRTHEESIRQHNRNLDCKFLKSNRKYSNRYILALRNLVKTCYLITHEQKCLELLFNNDYFWT